MADLGTDAGQATLNLSAKTLELLAKLLDKIFKFVENSPNRKKARLEYKIAKTENDRIEALKELNGKAGIVSYKKMKATGKTLLNVGVSMSEEDMKLFSDICKYYDVKITGLEHKKSNLKEIMIFRDDLEQFERAHARFINENKLNDIQAKIDAYDEKGYENLSDEEKEIYDGLKAEKEHIFDENIEQFNEEMNESILKDAVLDEDGNLQKMNLEKGLDRLTGYNLSKPDSGDFIIADAINLGNYIKVHGFDDSFINESGEKTKYVRSQYEVYKNNEFVKKFDDKRYQGRPKLYWQKIRGEMSSILGKPRYFYKFKTEDAYKAWVEDVTRQNKQELNNNTIESLKEELTAKGFEYRDGNVVLTHNEAGKDGIVIPEGQAIDKEFIKSVIGQGNLTTTEQKLDFKEAFLIGQSIESLEKSNELELKIGTKEAEIVVEDEPKIKESLEKELGELEKELNAEKENIEAIKTERKKVNAAQAERNVKNNSKSKEKAEDIRDESREEHIRENEQTYAQQSSEDWKKNVAEDRAKQQAANNNDLGQKNQTMEHATAVKDTVGRER